MVQRKQSEALTLREMRNMDNDSKLLEKVLSKWRYRPNAPFAIDQTDAINHVIHFALKDMESEARASALASCIAIIEKLMQGSDDALIDGSELISQLQKVD